MGGHAIEIGFMSLSADFDRRWKGYLAFPAVATVFVRHLWPSVKEIFSTSLCNFFELLDSSNFSVTVKMQFQVGTRPFLTTTLEIAHCLSLSFCIYAHFAVL